MTACERPVIDLQWFAEAANRAPGRPIIDLQWFAAEDEGRTEEPSEYKLRKAREDGKVAKSQELVAAVGLLLPALALALLAPYLARTMQEMVKFYFARAAEVDITRDAGPLAASFFSFFVRLTAPLAAVAVVSALFSNILQVGFIFSLKPITPDFSRIVPRFGEYLRKTAFSMQALFGLLKSVFKIAVIGLVAYMSVRNQIDRIVTLFTTPLGESIMFIGSLAVRLIIQAAIATLLLSVPDYLFQRHQYMESLKMTKEEVKEEHKQQEGDPLVRSRLRQRMRELLSRNMAANVPKADVVITNPTHFAVALEWDRDRMAAPLVTAKGQDEVALRIRRIAEENGVPVVENRPLARALYADVEIGDAIPEKYYQAIATVLAHVYAAAESKDESEAAYAVGDA
ncbi:MAG TPA: flagellar biosynthesis protein FlhB [Rectinemataceae bacterium]|nr:flagellar biosynthesis protein FlhB [Rectinemataceae bacterium]